MMVLSYFIGNKYYPVKYGMKRILGYLTLAMLLYFIAAKLEIRNDILDLIAKNSLLLLFMIIVFIFERKNLFGKKSENQSSQ